MTDREMILSKLQAIRFGEPVTRGVTNFKEVLPAVGVSRTDHVARFIENARSCRRLANLFPERTLLVS